MILVKKSNLYILTTLISALLVFGEIKFFMAIKSVNLPANLDFKYEVENFVFASIVLTLIVGLFLVYFIRKSHNIFKRLDMMIELSEYGKHDISAHLKQLGRLGEKINYLLYNLNDLNDKRSLRISSLSRISSLLIEKNSAAVFLLNRHGNTTDCSDHLLSMLGIDRSAVIKQNVNKLFKDINYNELFFELEKKRSIIIKEDVVAEINAQATKHRVHFYPIVNSNDQISHIIGGIEGAG
ncbi:PAS domain-containing protein [Candidatus Omnitrophota bacterium]